MKNLLLILLFLVFGAAAYAQDKIITINQDTIDCRIVSVNAERLGYEQKTSDKLIVGKSILLSEVLHYVRSGKSDRFYRHDRKKAKRQRPEHRLLFSLQGGLAHAMTDYDNYHDYMLNSGNPASVTDDYISKLKNGVHFNASLHYLLSSFIGVGVDYNFFHSASKGEFIAQGFGGLSVPLYTKLKMDERLYSQFAGPSVLFQQFPDKKKKIRISQTLAPGIILFRSERRDIQYMQDSGYGYGSGYPNGGLSYYNQANSISTGTTYGAKGSLSILYSLTPQLSAGLAGNFMWAKLHELSTKNAVYESEDQELEKPTNISHIDYGIIVRFNF